MDIDAQHLTFHNPQATSSLEVPILVISSVDSDSGKEHAKCNRHFSGEWVDRKPEHGRAAVLCGNAPSVVESFEEIKRINGDVFATNSGATSLVENGIDVDYQVVFDPAFPPSRIEGNAKGHLIASTAHPDFFKLSKNPIKWVPDLSWIDEIYADCDRSFCYIGGGVTALVSTLCMLFTLGYRRVEVFGADSSYEKNFHADCSKQEEQNPLAMRFDVDFNGALYKTSYDMKEQARVFMLLAEELQAKGMDISVHGKGLLPDMFKAKQASLNSER